MSVTKIVWKLASLIFVSTGLGAWCGDLTMAAETSRRNSTIRASITNGIWEMAFGGNTDNRGADHDFLGIRRQADVNYSSARAPFYVTSKRYAVYIEMTAQGARHRL